MSQLATLTDIPGDDASPYVGKLAHRLLRSLDREQQSADPDRWTIIKEMLTFAAQAEQRLAEQTERISFLESLSRTDELTGLANRRALDDFLQRTLAAARRYKEYGILAFADLDRFKEINDLFGHAAGDQVLQHVARILQENVRQSDFVARIGGDEFVVVLVRSDIDQGRKRIHTLKKLIDKTVIHVENKAVSLSVSFGIESYGPDSDICDLLKRADCAMYREKRKKRSTANQ